jgi:hypothetical protein
MPVSLHRGNFASPLCLAFQTLVYDPCHFQTFFISHRGSEDLNRARCAFQLREVV